jgi:hypothetical protein
MQMQVRHIAAAWQQAQQMMAQINAPAATSPTGSPVAGSDSNSNAPVNVDAASKCITALRKAAGSAIFLNGPMHQRLAAELGGASTATCATLPTVYTL